MDSKSATARHQRNFFERVYALGLYTDASLAARLGELGEPCDRSTLARYRSGDRAAPLGVLMVLLDHVDDPAAVLDVLARPLGLRVVPDEDPDTDDRGLGDRALELAALSGEVVGTVRRALSDGTVTAAERDQIAGAAATLRRAVAELEALARRGAA